MSQPDQYIKRCLELAALGAGHVAPNPMVGAVIVYEDRIIGEGYHQQYGQAHAEVNSINSVKEQQLISKSTPYVSLEPCAHFGKTAPCADLIIENKIPHVVIGCRDSFEAVNGKGIEKLLSAGVHVKVGVLEQECRDLNRRFFTFHEKKRPYIILKWAQSANGRMGSGSPKRLLISNELSNKLVHKWRSEEAAILVGTNTALQDDPSLTTRHWPGKDPLRIVIDTALRLPPALSLFDGKVETIVFNFKKEASATNLRHIKLDPATAILPQLLSVLHEMKLQSLIVEGGSKLLHSFIDAGLWDEARVITNMGLTAERGVDAPQLNNYRLVGEQQFLDDKISFYRNNH